MTRPSREEMEEQLVELLQTSSADEARLLAARLLERGILAVANAEPTRDRAASRRGMSYGYRTFVLVHENDLEAAHAILDELLGAEGDVPQELIEQEMAAAEDDPEAAKAWFYEEQRKEQKAQRALFRSIAIAIGAAVAWVVLKEYC